jgi:hypothetical protein
VLTHEIKNHFAAHGESWSGLSSPEFEIWGAEAVE